MSINKQKEMIIEGGRLKLMFDPVTNPSKTQQHFAEKCDINKIMKKYFKNGVIDEGLFRKGTPVYADVSQIPDYQESLNKIIKVQAAFDAMPSDLRKKFNQSPDQMLKFLADPANKAEAVELGLMTYTKEEREALAVERRAKEAADRAAKGQPPVA